MRTFILIAALLAGLPFASHAAQPAATSARTPAAEIDALIDRVAHAKGVVFIRNGSEYTATEAAAHLQRKREAAGAKVRTPEQFIDVLGSRSSMSGKPYRVRLADGREMDSATWLNGLLRDLRTGR
ncbi:DUF5329 domain-containing protein [Lysobacter sp. KIS68-7]|uniref:DUF5329 family protein n=1 Tax=Lysobacter sp. KIS68-7 TaxID=2904252 RepID=UPI001E513E49|nr:DUF5329 domain-containing protein [Lysobacter sp. KIS68-7]UHQ20098.1 DUF5329 domain-containing protein [Lysobacter sp. KIS68-7]